MSFRYDNRGKYRSFAIGRARVAALAKGRTRGSNRREAVQYVSPHIGYPEGEDFDMIYTRKHVWRHHDRFFKLAANFYGDPSLWWFIPWFNQKPLESDYKPGDVVEIPFPVDELYRFFA